MPRVTVAFDRLHRRMMLQADAPIARWLAEPAPQAIIMNISRLVEGWKVDDDPPPWKPALPAGIETPMSIAAMLTAEFQRAFPADAVEFVPAGHKMKAP